MNTRYIGAGGRITRHGGGVSIRDFSSQRLAFVVVMCVLLFISNPANETFTTSNGSTSSLSSSFYPSMRSKLGTYKLDWLGIEINISPSSSSSSSSSNSIYKKYTNNDNYTNYHLFSLSKSSNGVNLGILFNTIPICTYHGHMPNFCHMISQHTCHSERLFNVNNKAYTLLRMMQIIKIASFLLQFCYKYKSIPLFPKIQNWRHFRSNPLSLWSSVLSETNSVRDLISFSIFLYPALVVLEKRTIVLKHQYVINNWQYGWFFGASLTTFYLITIGGICNLIASILLSDKTGGMKGLIASSLGFIAAVKPNDVIVNMFNVQLTAGETLFSTFAFTFISSLFGFGNAIHHGGGAEGGEWDMGNIVSWTIGGLIGFAFGELL